MAEEEVAQVELPAEEEALPVDEVVEAAAEEIVGAGGLTDFTSPQGGLTIDEEAGTVTVSNTGGDHFAVYNGLAEEVNSFTLEADVLFKQDQGINSAALIFGLSSKTAPGAHWNGANVDSGRTGDDAGLLRSHEILLMFSDKLQMKPDVIEYAADDYRDRQESDLLLSFLHPEIRQYGNDDDQDDKDRDPFLSLRIFRGILY